MDGFRFDLPEHRMMLSHELLVCDRPLSMFSLSPFFPFLGDGDLVIFKPGLRAGSDLV